MLACMLSLAVAAQGYASVRAMEAECPMQVAAADPPAGGHAMHHMQGMEGMDQGMAMEPAEDAGEPAHPEDCGGSGAAAKHCGCVTGCQPASASMALPLVPASLPWMRQVPLDEAVSFRSHHSFRHWRPPAHT